MTEIRLRGIGKRFGPTRALEDVDLTIAAGELMTLVGPSGCGKSTLLNIIAGLEQPTAGDILFDGVPVRERSPRDRDVAFVFQSYALYPHMSVFDNIAFPLRMGGTPRAEIERRVRETAGLLQIEELLARRPGQLSGGQRQRVALGRAMIRRPAVFLLDEPLSNLDAKLRLETRAELKRLHRELATTFVYVTHDQTEAMTLSTRVAVMKDGAILQVGTPAEIYRDPADTFVATFMGSPPMNLLDAEWRDDALWLGEIAVPAPPAETPRLAAAREARSFVVGVRPEHLSVSLETGGDQPRAQVSLVEPLGSETHLHLLLGGSELVARVEPDFEARAGQDVGLAFAWSAASFFRRDDGKRLS